MHAKIKGLAVLLGLVAWNVAVTIDGGLTAR